MCARSTLGLNALNSGANQLASHFQLLQKIRSGISNQSLRLSKWCFTQHDYFPLGVNKDLFICRSQTSSAQSGVGMSKQLIFIICGSSGVVSDKISKKQAKKEKQNRIL